MSGIKITFPDETLVTESELIAWATDTITNGYANADQFDGTVKSAIMLLKNLGKIKFAKTPVDDKNLFVTLICSHCSHEEDCKISSLSTQKFCEDCSHQMIYKEAYIIDE